MNQMDRIVAMTHEMNRLHEEIAPELWWHTDLTDLSFDNGGTMQFHTGSPTDALVSINQQGYTFYSEDWELITPVRFRFLLFVWLFTGGKLRRRD